MKRLMLLVAFSIFVPELRAQRFEVGLEAGTVTTNKWIHSYDPNVSYAVTGRFYKNQGTHWQNGVRIDVQAITANKILDSNGVVIVGEQKAKFASPLVAFGLFSNYRQSFGRFYIYGGGTIGFVACSLPENNITPYESGKGFLFGIQVGGVLWVVKHIGIVAEAAPRYNLVTWQFSNNAGTQDKTHEANGFMAYPFLVGIRAGL